MAIAIDASSPALVSGASSTQTTASFSPPGGTLLVACAAFEALSTANATITLSNTGTALTWTQRARRDGNDSGGNQGIAAIYTAPNFGGQSGITVSAVSSKSGDAGGLKVFVVTGADLASPVGATGEGSDGEASTTPNAYTSTVAASRAFGVGSDFSVQGSPTSSDTGFGFLVASRIGGVAVYKGADTATAGSVVTLNFNNVGSFALWNWAAIEVLPGAPFVAGRGVMLGQAVNRAAFY